MEMHQIRYFLAVAEALNFTRAAEQCHVTQPALTRAIQKLEEELGGLLFRRERHLTHLTDLGLLMRPHLEQVLSEAGAARSTASSFLRLERARLKLGVMCTIGPMRFVEFLNRFHAASPGVEVFMQEGTVDQLLAQLGEGAIDVAVVAQPNKFDGRVDAQPLYRERFVVGFAPGHKFERQNAVRMADLEGESYLSRMTCEFRDHIRGIRESQGVTMRYCFRSEREDWIQTMAAAGLGLCVLPQFTPTVPGLATRPLIEPEIEREVSLVTIAGRRFSPAVAGFVRTAKAHAWPARRSADAA